MFSMNWSLIARCSLRYSLVYAGLTVGAVFALTKSELALLTLFGLGLAVLLFALGGTGTVRMGTAMANADSMGLESTIVDPADLQATQLQSDVKVLFYGIGLLVCGMAALVLVG
ncbi:hypothetical protein ZOD2009_10405 [Haladaptatus paucihalophilus DX253]|uniref:DUF8070 domain-containing protein n=2 Tax=Haladaptatus paucihalophilus DX253 TaxID=797209 RepID=E7QTF3_HALPU|nr:hypothetical protein ZOD2009_10405 [Haladaptatus paucihalophilus DX253]